MKQAAWLIGTAMVATLMGPRKMARRVLPTRAALLVAGVVLLSACGDDVPTLVFDPATEPTFSVTSTSTEPPEAGSSSTAVAGTGSAQFVVDETWVDATSNLSGIESYCGNVSFVSARPDRDQVIASVVGQGLFSNEPGSDEWVPFGRQPGSAPVDHRTSGVVYDPANPETFWESGYFGLGPPPEARASSVNRTDDGGLTFVAVGNELEADLVSVDLSDPERQTLLIGLRGGGRSDRVLRSTDGGSTWSDISDGLPADLGEASFPHVVDARTYLLGTHEGDRGSSANPGIFLTTDAGATWTKVFEEGVSGPPLVSMDGLLYWLLDEGGVISSSDAGASWTVVARDIPLGAGGVLDARRNRIVEMSDGTWLALDVDSMVMSSDRGVSWSRIGPPLPVENPAGFTYSEIRGALYLWWNYCDFEAGENPVSDNSIHRLDLEFTP